MNTAVREDLEGQLELQHLPCMKANTVISSCRLGGRNFSNLHGSLFARRLKTLGHHPGYKVHKKHGPTHEQT